MNYLLDTNIYIHILNGEMPNIRKKLLQKRNGKFYISSITKAELWFGMWNSERRAENIDRLENFLPYFESVDFNSEHARRYGVLKYEQRKLGKNIGENDLFIAAQALEMDAVLVTANEKEFAQIKDLRIENWLK